MISPWTSAKFEALIRALADKEPDLSVAAAMARLDRQMENETPGHGMLNATPVKRAEFAASYGPVRQMIDLDKKINAIKEMRAATDLGLKEAKDAVEDAVDLIRRGWISDAERAQLAVEEKEAISSILGEKVV